MQNIIETQVQARRHNYESWVVCMAKDIIEVSNKRRSNGFFALPEYYISSLIGRNRKADLAIIEIIDQNDNVILLIECKVKKTDFPRGENQLRGYMADLDCNYGILMNADYYRTLVMNNNGEITISNDIELNEPGIQTIVNYVNGV
ncbi:hypothetical protein CONCODRAFT_85496 [Conidiobolus coronatus NRRL 28638]|uniref:Type I restriction enzyme R protein N-terminal domain-containing protein n=1 Tax=Conidiobolus coronatus (strain ATCC 28846 / CBS 209.66 / NRRL 28638) TaxID=796925 RepID=A0A137P580_CONC2|nr:hypothetical protein CONCODRAFT_85496 [Conidiobolus coronatus NRRL 28638]|eukprot:KXN70109.1 hypothetical protein CONCODRAFT_85496 [Conidiobolus coronatus NRRL 28638]